MKQSGYSNNILITILGVMTGIIIFLASFTMQINNTILNDKFQIETVEYLGLFDNISNILENIAGKIHNTGEHTESTLKNSITPDLIKSNFKSLIDWLAGYDDMKHIMSVLNLTRFILSLSTIFSLLTFASVLAIMLFRSPFEMRAWIRLTSVTYATLYPVTAGLLHQVLHYGILKYGTAKLQGALAIQTSALEESLKVYVSYLTGFLPAGAVICGLLLFIGVETAILCICPEKPYDTALFNFSRRQPSIKVFSSVIIALLLLTIAANIQIISAKRCFTGTDFTNAIAFISQNTGFISVTDARNQEVCFLNIIILDENGDEPVRCQEFALYPAGSSTQIENICTGTEGSAAFLLEKGKYRIVFNADGKISGNLCNGGEHPECPDTGAVEPTTGNSEKTLADNVDESNPCMDNREIVSSADNTDASSPDTGAGSAGMDNAGVGSSGAGDAGTNAGSTGAGTNAGSTGAGTNAGSTGAGLGCSVADIPIKIENPVSPGRIAFNFELNNAGRTDLFITIGKTKTGTAYIKVTDIWYMP